MMSLLWISSPNQNFRRFIYYFTKRSDIQNKKLQILKTFYYFSSFLSFFSLFLFSEELKEVWINKKDQKGFK